MVYIKDEANQEQMDTLKKQLLSMENIDKVEFVSREEAFERQKAEYGDKAALLNGLSADILPHAYKVTVKDISQFDLTVSGVKTLENVLFLNIIPN